MTKGPKKSGGIRHRGSFEKQTINKAGKKSKSWDGKVPKPNITSLSIFETKTIRNRMRSDVSKAHNRKKASQFTVNMAFNLMPVYTLSDVDLLELRGRPNPCVKDKLQSEATMETMKGWPAHGLSGIWKDKRNTTLLVYLSWRPKTENTTDSPVNNPLLLQAQYAFSSLNIQISTEYKTGKFGTARKNVWKVTSNTSEIKQKQEWIRDGITVSVILSNSFDAQCHFYCAINRKNI